MTKTRKVITQAQIIHLSRQEAERFAAALQKPAKANQKLKQLFKKHGSKQPLH